MTVIGPHPPPSPRRDSPRTDAEPLAFTRTEFLAGTARVWGATTLLLIVGWAVLTGGFSLVVGAVAILLVSVPAVVIGSPGAYALGRLLRRLPRVGAHLLAFSAYGALVGVVTTTVTLPALLGDSGGGWIAATTTSSIPDDDGLSVREPEARRQWHPRGPAPPRHPPSPVRHRRSDVRSGCGCRGPARRRRARSSLP